MGTVPRRESVSNSSMAHRELLKWHCVFALFACAPAGSYEHMRRPLSRMFLRGLHAPWLHVNVLYPRSRATYPRVSDRPSAGLSSRWWPEALEARELVEGARRQHRRPLGRHRGPVHHRAVHYLRHRRPHGHA